MAAVIKGSVQRMRLMEPLSRHITPCIKGPGELDVLKMEYGFFYRSLCSVESESRIEPGGEGDRQRTMYEMLDCSADCSHGPLSPFDLLDPSAERFRGFPMHESPTGM